MFKYLTKDDDNFTADFIEFQCSLLRNVRIIFILVTFLCATKWTPNNKYEFKTMIEKQKEECGTCVY